MPVFFVIHPHSETEPPGVGGVLIATVFCVEADTVEEACGQVAEAQQQITPQTYHVVERDDVMHHVTTPTVTYDSVSE